MAIATWLHALNGSGDGVFTNGDTLSSNTYYDMLYSDIALVAGDKVYFEVLSISSSTHSNVITMVGMTTPDGDFWYPSQGGDAATLYIDNGTVDYSSAGGTSATGLISNPYPLVHGIAVDFTAGKFWVRDSGGYKNGNPVTGSLGATFDTPSQNRICIGNGGANLVFQGIIGPTFTYGPPTGFASAHGDAYKITGTVLVGSSPARRKIHVYNRATGELLKSAFSDAATGEYNITLATNDQVYTVTLEDTTNNKYESRVRDFITPTLFV